MHGAALSNITSAIMVRIYMFIQIAVQYGIREEDDTGTLTVVYGCPL